MPRFSKLSLSRLESCHADLQILFKEVIKYFDCSIAEGFRDKEKQDKAFASGNSQVRWPNGKHNKNPSHAVDVYPYPIDFKNEKRDYWFAGYVMGVAQKLKDEGKITHSIRWGGDWDNDKDINDNKFQDLGHFEIIS